MEPMVNRLKGAPQQDGVSGLKSRVVVGPYASYVSGPCPLIGALGKISDGVVEV